MKFQVAYVTNTGKTRKENQDSLLIRETLVTRTSMDNPVETTFEGDRAWFVVADGIGGEAAGDVASNETLRILAAEFPAIPGVSGLSTALNLARERLDGIARETGQRLGTTLAGLSISPEGGFVFNVGDCRTYTLRTGFLNRLTRDHSLIEEAGAAGKPLEGISRNVVTSAVMGGDADAMEIFTRPVQARPGDRFFICCDGLWGALTIEEMEEAFRGTTPVQALARLLATALPKSGDNISGIVVQVS